MDAQQRGVPAACRSLAASQILLRELRFTVPWSDRTRLDVPTFITCLASGVQSSETSNASRLLLLSSSGMPNGPL